MKWKERVEILYAKYNFKQGNKKDYKRYVINYGEMLLSEIQPHEYINKLDAIEDNEANEYNTNHKSNGIKMFKSIKNQQIFEASFENTKKSFLKIKSEITLSDLDTHYNEVKNELFFKVYNEYTTSGAINAFFNTRVKNLEKYTEFWYGIISNNNNKEYYLNNNYFEIDKKTYEENKMYSFKHGDIIYLIQLPDQIVAKGVVIICNYENNSENVYRFEVDYDIKFNITLLGKEFEQTPLVCCRDSVIDRIKIEDAVAEGKKEVEVVSYIEKFSQCSTIQKILYGGPGAVKLTKYQLDFKIDKSNYEQVTFHNRYKYKDFVGNIDSIAMQSIITPKYIKGPFTRILNRALLNKKYNHYLIIEDLNCGNVMDIFGDVFQLLQRDKMGFSSYPLYNENIFNSLDNSVQEELTEEYGGRIVLPPNLSIICTINSSNQNVFPLDTAFKHRFDYEIKSTLPSKGFIRFNIKFGDYIEISWIDFYTKLNDFILRDLKLKEDKQVGPYFVKNPLQDEDKLKSIQTKLAMYMWNDLHKAHSISNKAIFDNNKVHTLYEVDRIFREGSKQEITNILTAEFIAHFGIENE